MQSPVPYPCYPIFPPLVSQQQRFALTWQRTIIWERKTLNRDLGERRAHWYHHNNYIIQKLQVDSVHMCFVWHRALSPVPLLTNSIHIYSVVHRPPGHSLPSVHMYTFYVLITHATTTQIRTWMFPVPHQPPSSPALTSPRWEEKRLLFWNLSPWVYNGTTQYIFLGLTFQKE